MDGTLTHAIHDFDAIRATLGLPANIPILESIEKLPENEARATHKALDDLEMDIAHQAVAQPWADELLSTLTSRGAKLGIVTRNGREIADATLAACNLLHYFEADHIVSRNCCAPKPDPAGCQLLLQRWQVPAHNAVMVGDFQFDLEAGKRAGTCTLHLDVSGQYAWPEITDVGVMSFEPLLAWLNASYQASEIAGYDSK